jgi:5'-nucleotidase
MRYVRVVALVAALVVVGSGCQLVWSANRHAAAPAEAVKPWWCRSGAAPELTPAQCQGLSAQLDLALIAARARPHASDAIAGGATSSPYVAGEGAAFRFSGPTAGFAPQAPDTLLYDGVAPTSQLAAIEWNVSAGTAPEGFVGDHDVWTDLGGGTWRLRAWLIRPFENQNDLFAGSHPCLGATSATYDITDACYTSTHPEPLRVLVTNDDGYSAAGIDAVVEALLDMPNLDITVSAPLENQSGTGDSTTPGGVTATDEETASGYPATAVDGFPADSVLYALNVLRENPDLVVSGSNAGQNIVLPIVNLSGTVGAARVAARNGISAVAISQELGSPPDFPESAVAITEWVTEYLLGRAGPPGQVVANINVPTCTAGSIRGTATLPMATAFNSRPFGPTDCTSTVTTFADDLDAFLNGFVSISNAGTG